jgi:hypothetical protein
MDFNIMLSAVICLSFQEGRRKKEEGRRKRQ